MKYTLLLALILSAQASAQCFSPAPPDADCSYHPPAPVGPSEVCVEVCTPVSYSWVGTIAVAETTLPGGYQVVGWAGPCINGNCPDIFNQAHSDLRLNALRVNRAKRF